MNDSVTSSYNLYTTPNISIPSQAQQHRHIDPRVFNALKDVLHTQVEATRQDYVFLTQIHQHAMSQCAHSTANGQQITQLMHPLCLSHAWLTHHGTQAAFEQLEKLLVKLEHASTTLNENSLRLLKTFESLYRE